MAWFACGWRLFKGNWGNWLLMTLVMMVMLLLMSLVPLLGSLAAMLLAPVMLGGWFKAARTAEQGGNAEVSMLFSAFGDRRERNSLLVIGLLQILVQVVAGGLVMITMGSQLTGISSMANPGHPAMSMDPAQLFSPMILIGFLLMLVLMALVSMAFAFALPLVVLDGRPPVEALKLSFSGCWRNLGALAVFGLIYMLLVVIASIPFGLGLLILIPVTVLALYCGYREVYSN